MRTLAPLAALLLAFPFAGAGAATLDVTLGNVVAADYASCSVELPEESTVADLLDAAVAAGCISGWDSTDQGFGRYVTCIDDVCEVGVTYWALYVDGEYASCGIDCTYVEDGSAIEFRYETWLTYYLP